MTVPEKIWQLRGPLDSRVFFIGMAALFFALSGILSLPSLAAGGAPLLWSSWMFWTAPLAIGALCALVAVLLWRPYVTIMSDTVILHGHTLQFGAGFAHKTISVPLAQIERVERRTEYTRSLGVPITAGGYALALRDGRHVALGSDVEGANIYGQRLRSPFWSAAAEEVARRLGREIVDVGGVEVRYPSFGPKASWGGPTLSGDALERARKAHQRRIRVILWISFAPLAIWALGGVIGFTMQLWK